jgi:triosephosphate isomerase
MTRTKIPPFIAGNWKMHMTSSEAKNLASVIVKASLELAEAEIVLLPPFTALSEVKKMTEESPVQLGGQNLFWEEKGAFTGEISAPMLLSAGCQYVVVGHSERRQFFSETDETVNKKIKAALKSNLAPIVCIGESLEEREAGKTMAKVQAQMEKGLEGLSAEEMRNVIIAYEPIWAIGTGRNATPAQAEEVHSFVREKLVKKYGKEMASCAIILYGGSVKPANTYSLLKEKNIDGALVGGASLEAESFIQIVKEAIRAYKEKTWAL